MLVFTGGIGENAAEVRAEVCKGLEHLGVAIDPAANAERRRRISSSSSRCVVLLVPTDEDRVIARHTAAATSARSPP
jgi:acetate kinase